MRRSWRGCQHHLNALQLVRCLNTGPDQAVTQLPRLVGGDLYQAGDRVIVIHKDGKRVKSRLLSPLKPEGTTRTGLHAYEVKHADIVGKPAGRLYVQAPSTSIKGTASTFRVKHPSLDQFVALAPRTVTPIYSSYGATIVNLLDIHVAPPSSNNDPETSHIPRLEILEAGTGNGGLTLHLARAIAAANPPPPNFGPEDSEDNVAQMWNDWRSRRRAIVHTVEFEASRSRAAEKLIRSFRGALYWPHIDFHSGDVGSWVRDTHSARRKSSDSAIGVFDIVVLDLPAVHRQIQHVVDAMKEDGQLVVWVPQITQVAASQQQIEHLGLPLKLDQVLELGEGVSNGRRWDMRFVTPRVEQRKERAQQTSEDVPEEQPSAETLDVDAVSTLSAVEEEVAKSGVEFPTMVCRPIVGELTMGGGFVGLWRKVPKPKGEQETSRETHDTVS